MHQNYFLVLIFEGPMNKNTFFIEILMTQSPVRPLCYKGMATIHNVASNKFYVDWRSKCETIRILEENMGEYLHDHRTGKNFLNGTQNMLAIEKVGKLDHIKIKNFSSSHDSIKMKSMEWEILQYKYSQRTCVYHM